MLNWLKNLPSSIGNNKKRDVSNVPRGRATVIPRDLHRISRKEISDNALKVMYRLNKAGFDALLVGGSVRDLLLDGHPKDFDVATDATPEQVRSLFKNSRIIGRRFQIVHVRFGKEIIEVTTFRGHHDDVPVSTNQNHQSAKSAEGMLLRDNVYGTIEEDAARRDFTVNALYYSVRDFSVHDYCGGMQDLHGRLIRIIGNPEQRYREDPVRILRAVRFAAKLGFEIEATTEAPLESLGELLLSIPPARLFDEVLKLFMSGHALDTYRLLVSYNLFGRLFPQSEQHRLQGDSTQQLFEQAFHNTDLRIRENKTVTPAFIFAALLWPAVRLQTQSHPDDGSDMGRLHEASSRVIQNQSAHTSIPRRFQIPMREIWEFQLRLRTTNGRRAQRVFEHPRFRAAYDFLLLREQAQEIEPGLGQWWTDYQSNQGNSQEHPMQSMHRPDQDSEGGQRKNTRTHHRRSKANQNPYQKHSRHNP